MKGKKKKESVEYYSYTVGELGLDDEKYERLCRLGLDLIQFDKNALAEYALTNMVQSLVDCSENTKVKVKKGRKGKYGK